MLTRANCLTVLILMMLARRITSSPSLVTSNDYMGELIDVLNNIGDTLAEHKTAESLDTIAGAVRGQQAALKSFVQDQQKTLSEILQGHHNDMEKLLGSQVCSQEPNSTLNGATGVTEQVEKLAQDVQVRASEIRKLSTKLESTQMAIGDQMKIIGDHMALKSEVGVDLKQLQSAMEAEILMKQKTSMDSIKSVEEKTTANTLEVRAQILAANSKLQTIESELGSTREQLKSKIDGDRTATLKKLEEGMALVQETVQQLRQDLTSYKITSQQTTSSLDGRVVKINQDVLIALEKMTSDLKGVRGLCISQTTQNKEQAQEAVQKIRTNLEELESKTHTTVSQLSFEVEEVNKGLASAVTKMKADVEGAKLSCAKQASKSESQVKQMVNQIQSDLKKHEAQFQKEVDAVKASTETAVKEAKAYFIQELESLKQSLQPILKPKVSQQTTTTTTTRTPDFSDYYEFLSVYGDR